MISVSQSFAATPNMCHKWFKKEKIGLGKNCTMDCAMARVGLMTAICPKFCEQLCIPQQPGTAGGFLFKLTDLYPGLTTQEKALAAREPIKMMEAYKLSHEAESLCSNVFPTSRTNDESDACRHFIWAALLTNEFGREFTENLLNAHEQEPTQPEAEKAMDLANNRRGISRFEALKKEGKFSEGTIIDAFKNELDQGNLVVLKRRTSGDKK